MLHAPADSSLGPTGTRSSESWLLWIHSRGPQPASPQAPVQPPESAPTCTSPGGGRGGLTGSWAPAPRRAQAGDQARGCASPGEVLGFVWLPPANGPSAGAPGCDSPRTSSLTGLGQGQEGWLGTRRAAPWV